MNFTDGLDGLAPGLMMIASFAVMVLCYIAGSPDLAGYLLMPYVEGTAELMVVAGASAGACLGFLWFNAYPAQMIKFSGVTRKLLIATLIRLYCLGNV